MARGRLSRERPLDERCAGPTFCRTQCSSECGSSRSKHHHHPAAPSPNYTHGAGLHVPCKHPFSTRLALRTRDLSSMSLDAKIVLLGAQGVGKTSFVVRYVKNTFQEGNASTIGASFQAKKVVCDDCVIRLQIWDTAGQERFRSMAPIYYRSASCGILCYDITSEASFKAMHSWLNELKQNLDNSIIIHIVGTKLDLVSADPSRRQVPFESCLQYARAQLGPDDSVDACHEISAKDDEGVEEVFQAITRKIITRRRSIQNRYNEQEDRRQTIYLHKEDDEVVQRGCC